MLCLYSFLVCICITEFLILVTMRFLIVLNYWSLNFKFISRTLYLYSPPLMISVFDIVFYVYYLITAYCGYQYLSIFLLTLHVVDFYLYYIFVLSHIFFHSYVSRMAFSFSLILIFLVKLIGWP